MIAYDEVTPKNIPTGYIDNYWLCENMGTTGQEYTILPDCCMDIVFDFCTKTISICGAMTAARAVYIKPHQKIFGVRFAPGVLPAMLGVSAIKLRDAVIKLEEIDSELTTSLSDLFTIESHISKYAEFCEKAIKTKLLAISPQAILDLTKLPTDYTVNGLSRHLRVSIRQTERIFAKYIGITPKRFLQIKRFLNAYQSLQQEEYSRTDISISSGYFDQAHMHKEYQLLTNGSPRA